MLKGRDNQLSIYSVLYNRIPENHLLKRINKAVDFSFINKLLEKSYCKYYGRPAKEPELMIKILLLKQLYNLSDEKIIEEIGVNLAFMWFLGLNPDDELPHPSLLAKFRVHRIDDATLDDILTEIIRQCKEKGIIKDDGVSIDCTHVSANTIKKVPERVMKHISKEIFKKLEEEAPEVLEKQNTEIPNYKEIEDHKEAKRVMKNYIDGVIENVEEQINPEDHPKTYKLIKEAKEILEDPKFMQQK
ncbi:transposase, partial [Carboxydothermus pertinax]